MFIYTISSFFGSKTLMFSLFRTLFPKRVGLFSFIPNPYLFVSSKKPNVLNWIVHCCDELWINSHVRLQRFFQKVYENKYSYSEHFHYCNTILAWTWVATWAKEKNLVFMIWTCIFHAMICPRSRPSSLYDKWGYTLI